MGDEALKLQEAVQRASEIQVTSALLLLIMLVVVVAVVFVFVRSSNAQVAASKSQGNTLDRQLDLQSKQLDVFNRLDASLTLQNARNNEYHNNTQKNLIAQTSALDSIAAALDETLKKIKDTVDTLDRIEKNGKTMSDGIKNTLEELGEARKDTKTAADSATAANSGVATLATFMKESILEIQTEMKAITQEVRELRESLKQMNVTETKPPLPNTPPHEGD